MSADASSAAAASSEGDGYEQAAPLSLSSAAWSESFRVLWLGQFLVTASLTVIVPLLPFYLEQLGCTDARANRFWTAWALAAPALPLVIMAPIWGRIGDRFGRKAMVVRALFGIALAVTAMGLARTPLEFFLCRLAQGAFGGVDDAAAAFAVTEAPAPQRGRVMGMLQSATAAGALVGPLAGGFLSTRWGFAPILLVTGAAIATSGVLAARTLQESRHAASERARHVSFAGSAIQSLLRDRSACAFLCAGFLVQVGGYALVALFANRVRQLAPDAATASEWVGALQALTWAVTLLGAAWWGRRNDRVAVEKNFALAAAVCGLAVSAQALPSHAAWLAPLRALQGFCMSALGQSVFLRLSLGADPAQRGLRIGIANSGLTLGHVIGSLALIWLAGWLEQEVLFVFAGGVFLAAACVVAIGARTPRRSSVHVQSVVS